MYQKGEILLSAKGVGLSFKREDGNVSTIFKDINFDIHDIVRPGEITGQVLSLVGRSGIGKTTMIRLLAGLPIKHSTVTGTVLINNPQMPVNPGDMGIVPQNYYLPASMSIQKILAIAAYNNKAYKYDKKTIDDSVTEYLSAFSLGEQKDKLPSQLSGGQRQRAAIACQLLYGSNFLLMDEPFSGLDPLMVDTTLDLLSKVSKINELKTIIIISHDLRNACAISDTVLVLSQKGRKPEEGATIVKQIDLAEMGLAWEPRVKEMPLFLDVIRDIKALL